MAHILLGLTVRLSQLLQSWTFSVEDIKKVCCWHSRYFESYTRLKGQLCKVLRVVLVSGVVVQGAPLPRHYAYSENTLPLGHIAYKVGSFNYVLDHKKHELSMYWIPVPTQCHGQHKVDGEVWNAVELSASFSAPDLRVACPTSITSSSKRELFGSYSWVTT